MKRTDFSKLSIHTQTEKNSYFEHEDFIAGTPPFLRGIDATMFIQKSLITQLLVDFSSPEKSNKFLKEHILIGNKNSVLHFNTSTNSENSGIVLNSVDDFKILLKEIPLNNIEITISANENIISILGLFFAAIQELGFDEKELKLSIIFNQQNSISNQKQQPTIIEDFLIYTDKNLPNFKSIAILPPKTSEDSKPESELAYFLSESFSHIKNLISKGLLIDSIASKFSLSVDLSENSIMEIPKMRVARVLWTKMIQQFHPKNIKSSALQIHSNTEFSNNTKVLNALFGGVQSVISSNSITQVIDKETFITKTIDPWAGSTSIEKQTEEIALKTWKLFLELQKNKFSENQLDKPHQKNDANLLELLINEAKKRSTLEQLNSIIENTLL